MDGYQVAERLRGRWGSDRLKLVALTGYGGPDVLHRARLAGFDHHLVKPVSFAVLERILTGQD
jgi:CheY-like chemotaxis protein